MKPDIPFNLENLRKHLAQVYLARRILPEDIAARQKLLEDSVYASAVERGKHETEVLADLGLQARGLKHMDLQKWMWEWHQKLKLRLEAVTVSIIELEKKSSEH